MASPIPTDAAEHWFRFVRYTGPLTDTVLRVNMQRPEDQWARSLETLEQDVGPDGTDRVRAMIPDTYTCLKFTAIRIDPHPEAPSDTYPSANHLIFGPACEGVEFITVPEPPAWALTTTGLLAVVALARGRSALRSGASASRPME